MWLSVQSKPSLQRSIGPIGVFAQSSSTINLPTGVCAIRACAVSSIHAHDRRTLYAVRSRAGRATVSADGDGKLGDGIGATTDAIRSDIVTTSTEPSGGPSGRELGRCVPCSGAESVATISNVPSAPVSCSSLRLNDRSAIALRSARVRGGRHARAR